MKIKNVVCAPGRTGFYFDDQRAIKRGAGHDGMFYWTDWWSRTVFVSV